VAVDRLIPNSEHRARRRPAPAPQRLRPTFDPAPVAPAIREAAIGRAAWRRERMYRAALAASDHLAACHALTVSLLLMSADSPSPVVLLGLPLIVLVSKIKGLYDRDDLLVRKSTIDELPQLFQLATLYTLVVWLLEGVLIVGALSSHQVAALWGSLFVFAAAGRYVARGLVGRLAPRERCLFIGDASSYDRLGAKLEGLEVDLVGRMSMQRIARRGARTADTRELRDMFAYTNADRVIIESHVLPAEDMHDLIRAVKSSGVRVSLLPKVFDVIGSSVVMDEIEGMTLLGVRRFGLTQSSQLVKRVFDLAGSLLLLLAAAPVMIGIALAIKLEGRGRGPVLFRQERVGRDGRRFRICKFRTMCVDAEERKDELRAANEAEGGLFKIADDPRITRVGKILRKTSLDELPQLLNVVTGDMSLVGPRPLVVDEDEQITGMDRHRLALTPGMTGHWQILGSARVPLPEMVKIDYLYVAGWSLWADIKILLRTVPYMLSRRGM
jgi:exopolysaccharide biosynthesis polyprenyl glycosylphosphotransferase